MQNFRRLFYFLIMGEGNHMEFLVQKFGGTSVSSVEKIRHVARRALGARAAGVPVVIVVSAMAGETNRLLDLARTTAPDSEPKELDAVAATGEQVSAALTAMAIRAAGGEAESLLAHQIPIVTDDNFGNARIEKIETIRLRSLLKRGVIPVVAGFQGVTAEGRVSTLGRGGSDTTAVAIASALGRAYCEIYTDVDGVYTADPNLCARAVKVSALTYDHMLTLATLGAKVLHPRSVALGKKYQVPIEVRSSFSDERGTLVCSDLENSAPLTIALDFGFSTFTVFGEVGTIEIGSILAGEGIEVEGLSGNGANHTVILRSVDSARALKLLRGAGRISVTNDESFCKVSVVGEALGPTVQAGIFQILKRAAVAVRGVSTTPHSVSVLIPAAGKEKAMQILHDGLELGNSFRGGNRVGA